MKILYVCKSSPKGGSDGGAIYDNRVIKEFSSEVKFFSVLKIKRARSSFGVFDLPVWKWSLDKGDIKKIALYKSKGYKVIVSHESLFNICKYIEVDLFIMHNYFSFFTYKENPIIQGLYRLLSKRAEDLIQARSKKIVLISRREYNIFCSRYGCDKAVLLYPGLNPNAICYKEASPMAVRRPGSHKWLPKKKSLLKDSEIKTIKNNGFFLVDEDYPYRAITIIEDMFISGFKLKLLESLQRGDVILAFVDLREEISDLEDEVRKRVVFIDDREKMLEGLRMAMSLVRSVEKDFFNGQLDKFDWRAVALNMIEAIK